MSTYTDLLDDIEPKSSDEAIIASVLEKNRILKRKKVRNLAASVVALTLFMAMTITVGAVNDWDYTAVLQRVFNDNRIVADSMETEINYRVINNTYDGIDFELIGLYADDDSLFLVVEITSEKPVFKEPLHTIGGRNIHSLALLSERSGSEVMQRPDFEVNEFNFYVIDETRIIAVTFYTETFLNDIPAGITHSSEVFPFSEAIATGREFTLLFGDAFSDPFTRDYLGLPIGVDGGAELRFTVDEIHKQDVIMLYPDVPLRSVAVLKELKITPFGFLARFEGNGIGAVTYTHDMGIITNIHVKMNDGEIIPFEMWLGGSRRGIISGFSIGYHGFDHENHSWYGTFQHDMLLVIDDIVAVIIDDTEIPITR